MHHHKAVLRIRPLAAVFLVHNACPSRNSPLGSPTQLIRLPACVQEFPTGVTNGAEWYPVYGGMQVALLSYLPRLQDGLLLAAS